MLKFQILLVMPDMLGIFFFFWGGGGGGVNSR